MEYAPRFMGIFIRSTLRTGELFVAEIQGKIVGVALWDIPGGDPSNFRYAKSVCSWVYNSDIRVFV